MLVAAEVFCHPFTDDPGPNTVDNVHLSHVIEEGLIDKGIELFHGLFIAFAAQIQSGFRSSSIGPLDHIDLLALRLPLLFSLE